jgi:hypothetical protein
MRRLQGARDLKRCKRCMGDSGHHTLRRGAARATWHHPVRVQHCVGTSLRPLVCASRLHDGLDLMPAPVEQDLPDGLAEDGSLLNPVPGGLLRKFYTSNTEPENYVGPIDVRKVSGELTNPSMQLPLSPLMCGFKHVLLCTVANIASAGKSWGIFTTSSVFPGELLLSCPPLASMTGAAGKVPSPLSFLETLKETSFSAEQLEVSRKSRSSGF